MEKQTAVQQLLEEVILEREKSISVEFREALDFVITAIKTDYKEMEKQQIIDACGSMYSEDEVLEQLNLLMSLPSSTLDEFTDNNGKITIKFFEQFKKK
jgi:hypothetical protein